MSEILELDTPTRIRYELIGNGFTTDLFGPLPEVLDYIEKSVEKYDWVMLRVHINGKINYEKWFESDRERIRRLKRTNSKS